MNNILTRFYPLGTATLPNQQPQPWIDDGRSKWFRKIERLARIAQSSGAIRRRRRSRSRDRSESDE